MTAVDAAGFFGAGGAEPWSNALAGGGSELVLQPDDGPAQPLEVSRWIAEASAADRSVLRGLSGPVLDVGCGPGRMIRAALEAGLDATGLDVEPAAVRRCFEEGLPVLERSVFEPLPREGRWGAVLLLDGNIGIGGDPAALLARCAALVVAGGAVVAEVDADPDRDDAYTARVTTAGGDSAPFRWAEAGEDAVRRAAGDLRLEAAWSGDGRRFLRFRTPAA